jgi:GDP-L-fucose synthase
MRISKFSNFHGETKWDSSKPDGTPRKVLDVSRLKAFGWEPKISLDQGIQETIAYFEANYN